MTTLEQVMSRPDTVEEAVSFGVAILDEHQPGWAEGVDVPTLILSDSCDCVLGHLFGSYDKGCEMLGLYEETPSRCGFNLVDGDDRWEPLQAEWMRVITERQS